MDDPESLGSCKVLNDGALLLLVPWSNWLVVLGEISLKIEKEV